MFDSLFCASNVISAAFRSPTTISTSSRRGCAQAASKSSAAKEKKPAKEKAPKEPKEEKIKGPKSAYVRTDTPDAFAGCVLCQAHGAGRSSLNSFSPALLQILFCDDVRPAVKAENPALTFGEVGKARRRFEAPSLQHPVRLPVPSISR